MLATRSRSYARYGLLALRVAVGLFFLMHGLGKFGFFGEGGLGTAVGQFAQLQLPAPEVTAPILAVVEMLGGIAMIFGVLARTVALLLSAIVIAEIILGKLPQTINPLDRNGYLFELALLCTLLVVTTLGPGALALEDEASADT